MKDKIHIITIFAIIIALVIIGIVADKLLEPKSFNEHGHYRWDAVNELLTQNVVNQNIKTCAKCHKNIYLTHEKDAHYSVPCVDCHGAGNLHVAFHEGGKDSEKITKEQAALKKEYNLEGCLFCHRKLKARPSDFPQIDKDAHYKFLNVTDSKTKCVECHNPHEPIFLLTEARQARLHPIVYKCTECHTKKPDKDFSNVPSHPKIFECKDCHADIVKDFNEKPHHKYVECRTCHLFHKESENIGRMYKNGNAKFCLLCHESKTFKNDDYPPKVKWPSHIGKLAFLVNLDQKICINCHANKIHKMSLKSNSNPHAANWRTEHKTYIKHKKENNENPSCGNCHQNEFCSSCHGLQMPHPEGFTDGHKDIVKKNGKQLCMKCHVKEHCGFCHDNI